MSYLMGHLPVRVHTHMAHGKNPKGLPFGDAATLSSFRRIDPLPGRNGPGRLRQSDVRTPPCVQKGNANLTLLRTRKRCIIQKVTL